MEREKSCGALVFRLPEDVTEPTPPDILLIRHRKGGHWSFPKGHVEEGESERQTALREVCEETGLKIKLISGFRHSVEYAPKPGVQKQVVYFLGYEIGGKLHPQEEEISELRWFSLPEALRRITYDNDIHLMRRAKRRISIYRDKLIARGERERTE